MATAFSRRRGLEHAGLVTLAVVVGLAAWAASGKVADPRKMGEASGRFVLFVFAVAYGMSWLWQSGRRRGFVAAAIALGALAAAIAAIVIQSRPLQLSAAMKAPLERADGADGAPVLRHPYFAFTVPDPGPGFVASEQVAAMFMRGDDPATHAYALVDLDAGAGLVVVISLQREMGQRELERWFAGVQQGFVDALVKATGDAGDAKRLASTAFPAQRRADAHWLVGERGHARFHVWAQRTGGDDLLVLVIGFSREDDRLGEVVSGAGPP
jgi:hypothetical protein